MISASSTRRPSDTSTLYVRQAAPVSMASRPTRAASARARTAGAGNCWGDVATMMSSGLRASIESSAATSSSAMLRTGQSSMVSALMSELAVTRRSLRRTSPGE